MTPRIAILQLPPYGGADCPFVLVLSEWAAPVSETTRRALAELAGARAVLVFDHPVLLGAPDTEPTDAEPMTVPDLVAEALRTLAPGHPAVRIWGRLEGATEHQAQEGNAWAASPQDIGNLVAAVLRRAP